MATPATIRPRVLVIDDDGDATYVIVKLLQAMDCAAEECSDPYSSVASTKRLKPHLVLLDLIMPRLDGIKVAQQLRQLEPPPPMIVALTGVTDPRALEECRLAGFHSFIVKPLTIEVLHNLLAEARTLASETEG